ncbi:DUF1996 domain-containing protein [Streptomyces avermitilis]|uniref:DUF1996 domain-containing protein n=1 Tax=Streptomyces avermitilis TaxID=33903 RepID=UPI0034113B95
MGRNTRRRPTGPRRATFAAVALILGGGGLLAANVYASATEGGLGSEPVRQTDSDGNAWGRTPGAATIDCPDVGDRLTAVPDRAKPDVDKELALLDQQIAEAYQRLQESAQAVQQDSGFDDSAITNPLKEKRAATIERIVTAIDQVGDRPQGLEALAACGLRASDDQTGDQDGNGQDQDGQDGQNQAGQEQQQGDGQDQGNQQAGNGPVAADFVDITTVQPNVQNPRNGTDASRGTFATSCGVNAEGLFNSDNVIVAPGVTNGAHHFHDYVGNQDNQAFATDDDLANADTSCENEGDKSSYYWPVLRLQNGTREKDADAPGGGTEGNAGEIVTPQQVTLTFTGNPRSKVVAMPRLLRIITGDAKAFVNGNANANASWSCTGYEDRQLKDKYPVCPKGSDVVRSFKFQSCWDGQNIDSANHRTHVAFADAEGNCAGGFRAIPQLVQRIVYDVDAPSLEDGGRTTPLFAVDSFPEQLHKPVTDHGDFINVFDEDLMQEMVDCINDGRKCGADADPGSGSGSGSGDEPQETSTPTPAPDASAGAGGESDSGNAGGQQTSKPSSGAPGTHGTEPSDDGPSKAAHSVRPKADTTPSAEIAAATASPDHSDDHGAREGGKERTTPAPATGGKASAAAAGTEPQAVNGGLADTGARMWPAAVGGILLIAGCVLLRRVRRPSA